MLKLIRLFEALIHFIPLKKKIILLLWTLFLLGIVGMGGELYLKHFKPQIVANSLKAHYQFGCFEKGTYYFLRFKHNAKCLLSNQLAGFNSIEMDFNSLGLRNREVVIPKPTGVRRVLFLGDSFTVGWGVEQELAFPQVVESNMKSQGVNFESVNAGLTASGMGRQYLFLKNEATQLQPDEIVVALYLFNDIAHDAYRPFLEVDEKGLPIKIGAISAFVDSKGNLNELEDGMPKRLFFPIVNNSHLFALIYDRLIPNDTLKVDTYRNQGYVCLYRRTCHELDANWDRTLKLIKAMDQISVEIGAKLRVVLIPSEISVDRSKFDKYGFPNIPLLDFTVARERMGGLLDQLGVPYLDLYDAIASASATHQTYFEHDDHWNAYGHQVAAQEISNWLSTFAEAK